MSGGDASRGSMHGIVLFDIDGTIMHAGKTPAKAILRAIEEVYGVEDPMPPRGTYSFAGKTDPEIVADLLSRKGYPEEEIQAHLEEVFDRYIRYLEAGMRRGDDAYLYPGILPLLCALDERDDIILGLLTGNIEEGARIKLDRFDIADYFRVGAYGSDSPDRNELPGILLGRVREMTGRSYGGADVVIIGDSVQDIRCARAIDATAIAVATGTTSRRELAAAGPDHLFEDLSRTDLALDVIDS